MQFCLPSYGSTWLSRLSHLCNPDHGTHDIRRDFRRVLPCQFVPRNNCSPLYAHFRRSLSMNPGPLVIVRRKTLMRFPPSFPLIRQLPECPQWCFSVRYPSDPPPLTRAYHVCHQAFSSVLPHFQAALNRLKTAYRTMPLTSSPARWHFNDSTSFSRYRFFLSPIFSLDLPEWRCPHPCYVSFGPKFLLFLSPPVMSLQVCSISAFSLDSYKSRRDHI